MHFLNNHSYQDLDLRTKMKPSLTILILFIFLGSVDTRADDWWQFRGVGGVSVANAKLPTTFDDETNVAWKIPMPGKGASSPIVVETTGTPW